MKLTLSVIAGLHHLENALDFLDLFRGALVTTSVLAFVISLSCSCFITLTPGPVTPVFRKWSAKLLPAGSCVLLELPPSGAVGTFELLEISNFGGAGNSGTLELALSADLTPIRSISRISCSSSSSSAK